MVDGPEGDGGRAAVLLEAVEVPEDQAQVNTHTHVNTRGSNCAGRAANRHLVDLVTAGDESQPLARR